MTNLAQLHPWGLVRDLDRLFVDGPRSNGEHSRWFPRVDVFDKDTNLVVRAELPGVGSDDIEVTVESRTLTITGTREFQEEDGPESGGYRRREIFEGGFKRTVLLPVGADTDAITAASKDGILEITVPKKAEVLPRKVNVDVQR